MELRDYEQYKFAIAEILRATSNLAATDRRDWQERLQNLFTRLAEDRFNLVVVGRFNRGKTSLMNAILATDRLPTGIVPLTSVITTVTYGSRERVVLRYDERILTKEVPIEALSHFITQDGNPGNVQRVRGAEVQVPAEFLRRGFYFVDTPGLGSAIAENTLTTESFLPEADAFLLVTSYESPLSEEEIRFFKAASARGRRIFVVLNKHDTVSKEEREQVLAFVLEQLQELFAESMPKLFSVSALHGLEAKRSRNEDLLTGSGIRALEEQLTDFLLAEKSVQFLLIMCDRTIELLSDLTRSAETANLMDKTGEIANEIRCDVPSSPVRFLENPLEPFSGLHRAGPCEICASVREQIWNLLCKHQYDLAVSTKAQRSFADRGGFCPFHTWEYKSMVSPYGVCNGYPALLDRLAKELSAVALSGTDQDSLLNAMKDIQPSNADCSLCNERDKAEANAIKLVSTRLAKNEANSLDALSALCLPHLLMLSAQMSNSSIIRKLIKRQAELLRRISEDLKRNALKTDAARRYLASQEETAAAERALLLVAGFRNINFDCRSRLPGAVNLTNARP